MIKVLRILAVIGMLLLRTACIILGWLLIPLMTLLGRYHIRKSKLPNLATRDIYAWKDGFMFPWGNEEDGIVAGLEYLDKPLWFRIIYWSAKRNPANNLRYVPYLRCDLAPNKITYELKLKNHGPVLFFDSKEAARQFLLEAEEGVIEPVFKYTASQGIYWNYRTEFIMPITIKIPFTKKGYFKGDLVRFWIGWKIYPSDTTGVPTYDYRYHGAGFANQFKVIKRKEEL